MKTLETQETTGSMQRQPANCPGVADHAGQSSPIAPDKSASGAQSQRSLRLSNMEQPALSSTRSYGYPGRFAT